MDQPGQHDHRPTQRPQCREDVAGRGDFESPAEPHQQRELEKDQPEPARDEKPRQLALRFPAHNRQKHTRPGEKREDRRAEMGDPACEENRGRGSREIGRLDAVESAPVEKIPRVVERHHDHDEPAEQIHGFQPGRGRGERGVGSGHGQGRQLHPRGLVRRVSSGLSFRRCRGVGRAHLSFLQTLIRGF